MSVQPSITSSQTVPKYFALYDYEARGDDDMSFKRGESLDIIDDSHDKWWLAKSVQNGSEGYVPSIYIAPVVSVECNDATQWYHGCIGRNEAERRLGSNDVQEGTFIIRDNESVPGAFSLSVRVSRCVSHYKIKRLDNDAGFYIGKRSIFPTLADLVKHYQQAKDGLCVKLTFPFPKENENTPKFGGNPRDSPGAVGLCGVNAAGQNDEVCHETNVPDAQSSMNQAERTPLVGTSRDEKYGADGDTTNMWELDTSEIAVKRKSICQAITSDTGQMSLEDTSMPGHDVQPNGRPRAISEISEPCWPNSQQPTEPAMQDPTVRQIRLQQRSEFDKWDEGESSSKLNQESSIPFQMQNQLGNDEDGVAPTVQALCRTERTWQDPFCQQAFLSSAADQQMNRNQQPFAVSDVRIEGDNSTVFIGNMTSPTFILPESQRKDVQVAASLTQPGEPVTAGPRSHEASLQHIGDKTRSFLKTLYRTEDAFIQMLPRVDDDVVHNIDVYTNLQLKISEGHAVVMEGSNESRPRQGGDDCGEQTDVINSSEYKKLFQRQTKEKDLVKRFVLIGIAGLGKSTFLYKVAYDWAVESCVVLAKYTLVFVLKMCVLDQTSDLIDSVFDQLLGSDSPVTKKELESFIQHKPSEVMILLDGFDELKTTTLCEASFGSILRALNRQIYRECCICVTTRPSHTDRLMAKTLVQNPCTHVHLLGYSEQDVKNYVHRVFTDESNSASALINCIEASNTLSELSKSPMLVHFMCLLWRENAALPETTSSLFQEVIDHIFIRKRSLSEKERSELILSIGEVALRGLLAADQKLSFGEEEFQTDVLALALKVGILTRQRVFRNLNSCGSIEFIHKAIQEFCAAKYWQSQHSHARFKRFLVKAKWKVCRFQQTLDIVCGRSRDVRHFEYLLRFCCGENEQCANQILKSIIGLRRGRMRADFWIDKLLLSCYFEGRSDKTLPETCIDSLVTTSIKILYDGDYYLTLVHFLTKLSNSEETKACLARVESVNISGIISVSSLAAPLRNMVNLGSLILSKCLLTERVIAQILLSLAENTHLTMLDLSANKTLGGTMGKWASRLKYLRNLEVVCMMECNVQSDDVEHIAHSLSDMTNLTVLDLTYNRALGGTAQFWSRHLHHMKHLHKLVLCDCSLQHTDVEHIARSLQDMSELAHLNLSFNKAFSGLADKWSRYLRLMRHLRSLELCDCSLQSSDVKYIAWSVNGLSNLTELNLSRNSTLGDSAKSWSHHLCQMKHLRRLSLSGCLSTRGDVQHITLSVRHLMNLTDLDLTGTTRPNELPLT